MGGLPPLMGKGRAMVAKVQTGHTPREPAVEPEVEKESMEGPVDDTKLTEYDQRSLGSGLDAVLVVSDDEDTSPQRVSSVLPLSRCSGMSASKDGGSLPKSRSRSPRAGEVWHSDNKVREREVCGEKKIQLEKELGMKRAKA